MSCSQPNVTSVKKTGHFKEKCSQRDEGKKVAELKSEEPVAVVSMIQGREEFADKEAEFFVDCFHLSVAEDNSRQEDGCPGECSPMPKGLSLPTGQHLGQVAGIQGVCHMRCEWMRRWIVGHVEGLGKVGLPVYVCQEAYGTFDPPRRAPESKSRAHRCV